MKNMILSKNSLARQATWEATLRGRSASNKYCKCRYCWHDKHFLMRLITFLSTKLIIVSAVIDYQLDRV